MRLARARALVMSPVLAVLLVYVIGVVVRVAYTLRIQRPQAFIYADMGLYVGLARKIASHTQLLAPDVTHPLGYSALLAVLFSGGESYTRAVGLQLVVSALLPLAVGLLGLAAVGRRTGLLAVVFASVYFPFIEYGALFLSEVHFTLWLALAFAGFFAARRARRRAAVIGLAMAGGVAISIAAAFKSVALPAAFAFLAVDGLGSALAHPGGSTVSSLLAWLKPWAFRVVLIAAGAAPLLGVMARVCTRANRGRVCVTGNKVGSDFLLGHTGRVADVEWSVPGEPSFTAASPGALLRNYAGHVKVPYSVTDSAANTAAAWRWIFANPGDAVVLSLDHVFDTFFGSDMWPTLNGESWRYGHLSQYLFVVFLFIPTLFACAPIARRGAPAFLTSRAALLLAPVAALTAIVAIATGEVRYRIPFDIFFITIACAYFVGDLDAANGFETRAKMTGKQL
jgi:hypothetical protein